MNAQCALGGLCCRDVVARFWFCFFVSQLVSARPVWCMLALPVTPCLSLFAFLCVRKCHVNVSGAGNVPGRLLCWPGNG